MLFSIVLTDSVLFQFQLQFQLFIYF